MAIDRDTEELDDKPICFQCVGEAFLSRGIETQGAVARCDYCQDEAHSFGLKALADRATTVFDQHYVRTSDQPTSMQCAMQKDSPLLI